MKTKHASSCRLNLEILRFMRHLCYPAERHARRGLSLLFGPSRRERELFPSVRVFDPVDLG